jgi:hypothetical protein
MIPIPPPLMPPILALLRQRLQVSHPHFSHVFHLRDVHRLGRVGVDPSKAELFVDAVAYEHDDGCAEDDEEDNGLLGDLVVVVALREVVVARGGGHREWLVCGFCEVVGLETCEDLLGSADGGGLPKQFSMFDVPWMR